jgi:predicted RNA binding protein YcfA (HicA-like mRNA interferase family)
MTRLPRDVSGQECIKVLEKVGFVVHTRKGSHVTMKRENPPARVTVPDHRTLQTGMLRGIIRQAGMTVQEFVDLL